MKMNDMLSRATTKTVGSVQGTLQSLKSRTATATPSEDPGDNKMLQQLKDMMRQTVTEKIEPIGEASKKKKYVKINAKDRDGSNNRDIIDDLYK